MRLLTVDARRFGRDHAALSRVIGSAEADVACVHGAPQLLRWRSKCAALARRAGLVVVTGGRTAGGELILSSLGVDVLAVRDVRSGAGGAALAGLRHRGSEFLLASTDGAAAEADAEAALRALVPGELPAIVCAGERVEIVCAGERGEIDGTLAAGPGTELADGAGRVVELSLPVD